MNTNQKPYSEVPPYRIFSFSHQEPPTETIALSSYARASGSKNVGLIAVIEIEERWHYSRETSTNIWQNFIREYNRSPGQSTLTKFEEALRHLNQFIPEASQKLQHPINCCLVTVENNEIHFSTLGSIKVLLVRDHKMNDVSNAAKNASVQQFSSVTSGDLDEDDFLFCTNSALAKTIKGLPESTWQTKSLVDVIAAFSRNKNNFDTSRALIGTAIQYSSSDPFQQIYYWEKTEQRLPVRLPEIHAPKLDLKAAVQPLLGSIQNIISNLRKNKTKRDHPKKDSFQKQLLPYKAMLQNIPWRMVGGVVVLLMVIGGLFFRDQIFSTNSQVSSPTVTLLDELKNTSPELFLTTLSDKFTIEKYNALTNEEKSSLSDVASTHSVTIVSNPETASTLPSNILSIDATENRLALLDATGQIWNYQNDTLIKLDQTQLIQQPLEILAYNDSTTLITDKVGNIWFLGGDSPNQPKSLSLPTQLASNPKTLQKFGNNLYIHDTVSGKSYRVTNYQENIVAAPEYKLGQEAHSLNDWAINGEIITITNGAIQSYSRNTASDISASFNQISNSIPRITALEGSQFFYVANGKYVLQYSTTGQLNSTRFFANQGNFSDIALQNGQTMWLASEKNLYKISP
jgi:hypothetical protein